MKRVAGASGRMRKNEEGEWEWSDDGADEILAAAAETKPAAASPATNVCISNRYGILAQVFRSPDIRVTR